MSLLTNRLTEYLDATGVAYEIVHHRLDFSAQHTAADTHTPGRAFAKPVVLKTARGFVLAVIPAHLKIDFGKAHDLLGPDTVLADEADIATLFPDCEVGAEPVIGHLYGLPVYLAPDFTEDAFITFNGGTHHEAIRMRYEDFAQLCDFTLLDLCWRR